MPGGDLRALTAQGLLSSRSAGPVLRSDGRQWAVTVLPMRQVVFSVEGNDVPDVDMTDYRPVRIMSESKGSVGYDAWLRRHPSHPGRHAYHAYTEDPLGEHSQTASVAAHRIGVPQVTLSRVLNWQAGISVSLALKRNPRGQWPDGTTGPEDAKLAAQAS